MLVHLLMAFIMPSVISTRTHGKHDRLIEVDFPIGSLSSKVTDVPFHLPPNPSNEVEEVPFHLPSNPSNEVEEVPFHLPPNPSNRVEKEPFHLPPNPSNRIEKEPFHLLPNLTIKMEEVPFLLPPIFTIEEDRTDEAEITDETHVPNPTSPSTSGSEESTIRTNFDESTMRTNSDNLSYLHLQDHIGGYGSDNSEENRTKYCIWYDNEKEKEYQLQNGTEWSGNGCKSFECKNGVIIPDPSCCKIETHLNGYTSTYYLYKNQGEKWIKACELLTCDSGLITKEKRILGCCVYDHTGSKADGESWWAYSEGLKDGTFCKVGTCNNGKIDFMQIEEGGAWRNGCFEHICKDSDFVMSKVNLPGSCNINHGGCIVNGTIEKIWPNCEGIFCINGNLFKGELKYCSEKALLLYKKYNS